MKNLSFRQFLEVGSWEWQVQRDLLIGHWVENYRYPFHAERKEWVTQRNRLLRHYARGPLGIHRRIRQTRMINAIRRLDLPPDARILDAGCGHAYSTLWLGLHYSDYDLQAIEIDPDLVKIARRTASAMGLDNLNVLQGDVSALDTVGAYDLVFSLDLLEHIEDDVGTLRAFRRALRPGGQLLLHLPRRHQDHWRLFSAFRDHTTPEHVRDEYTADEICQRLAMTGFEVEYLRYGFGKWGELAFELNNLFWRQLPLRLLTAFLLHPLCVWLGYMDTRQDYEDGNSLLVLARSVETPAPEDGTRHPEEGTPT